MELRPLAVVGVIILILIVAITVDSRRRTVDELTDVFEQQIGAQLLCVSACSSECFIGVLEDGVMDFKEKEDGCLMDCTERLCPTTE